ncbi:hypothetical protein ACJ41O_010303 [Fusarium nematophilum]
MTAYDELAQADADNECRTWIRKLIDATEEVVAFVDARLDGKGTGEYLGFLKGPYNVSFHVGFGDQRPSALIRFAKPGRTHTPWRAEKVENEVCVIEYVRENTTIPVPSIHSWGLAEESPQQLGPFIIMDFIEGTRLSTLLKQPSEDEDADMILNPAMDDKTLDIIYDQLADYMFQLSYLEFPLIGAINKNPLGDWAVISRPLTYDMNELVTGTGFPTDKLPFAPFHFPRDLFDSIARQRLSHLETQRNLASDEADVKRRFIARHGFKHLIPKHCVDDPNASFKLFCDDLQPENMLIDPETLRITAVLGWEFTNSMPAQFVHDPPWWLLLRGPDLWLDRGKGDEFMERYVPRMEQFLRALERVEERAEAGDRPSGDNLRLSERMRESWRTGRFWFNYAARTCLDMDDVYWHALHDQLDSEGRASVEEAVRTELEPLVRLKMEQRKAYEEEVAARFTEGG